MKSIWSSMAVLAILVSWGTAAGKTSIIQVTSSAHEDSLPQLKGDYLVWQSHVAGDWEIFLYDTRTRQKIQVTANDHNDLAPCTDGSNIAWQSFVDGEWDIVTWADGEQQVVSEAGSDDLSPRISNGLVVWTSELYGAGVAAPLDIILYNLSSRSRINLSAHPEVDPENVFDDHSPGISDETVLWLQSDEDDNTVVYVYDRVHETVQVNPESWSGDAPNADGSLRVFARHDGRDWEIFLYNGHVNKYHQITNNDVDDTHPSLSGNRIAWTAQGEIFLAECKFLTLVTPQDRRCLSRKTPETFLWEGIGYESFKLEFAKDQDFRARTITLPKGNANWVSETFYTPSELEWKSLSTRKSRGGRVYWRMIGKDSGGNVDYSAHWLLTLSNE